MPITEPLFREEVLAERQSRWLGTVLLAPRMSFGLFAAFGGLATAGIVLLATFGSYTRKATIAGWLVPQGGLVQVFAPQAAVVSELFVTEGAAVREGERLIALSTELRSVARGATQTEIARRLEARRNSMLEARGQLDALGGQRVRSLESRIATLRAEVAQLDSSIALQAERVELARGHETRQRDIQARGLISVQELQKATEARLEQESKRRELMRNRIASQRELLSLEGELEDLPLKSRSDLANVDRDIAQLEQELAEVEARREIVIPAPQSGTVTSVMAERGGRASPNVPLLSLVPAGSKLEADLFAPSRSIGFLRPGQRVRLRYAAYPYQKFGHYEGTLASISRSSINPGELPPQLAGLTSLTGTSEPVYRITVVLASQTVTAYGKPIELQPGMQLTADVLIEKRRLYQWMLEPLTAMGRR